MAFDSFLKIAEIKGEALDKKHAGEIEIESFSWGVTQTGSAASGSGHGAGKCVVQDFSFVKKTDKATPNLMQFCCTGKHIPTVEFFVRKAGGEQVEFIKYKFSDVIVSSFQTNGNTRGGGEDIPTETVTLNFTKVSLDYQEQGQDGKAKGGPVHGGWDVKANTTI